MGYAVEAIRSVKPELGCFSEFFNRMFSVEVADTEKLRRDAFRLRYRVYCEERNFERREHFPDRLESDEFDAGASHAIVRHRETGTVVGAVRLILRGSADPHILLPVEKVCGSLFDHDQLDKFGSFRNSVAEVSRFAVSKGAVAQVMECAAGGARADGSTDYAQAMLGGNPFQWISLGLISVLFKISAARGIDHWYALMEPALARHLSRLGLRFTRIGPLVNHRGKRQPMLASLVRLRQEIRIKNPQLHELIEYKGKPQMRVGRPERMSSSRSCVSGNDSAAELA